MRYLAHCAWPDDYRQDPRWSINYGAENDVELMSTSESYESYVLSAEDLLSPIEPAKHSRSSLILTSYPLSGILT